jgi:hypothetical protein
LEKRFAALLLASSKTKIAESGWPLTSSTQRSNRKCAMIDAAFPQTLRFWYCIRNHKDRINHQPSMML